MFINKWIILILLSFSSFSFSSENDNSKEKIIDDKHLSLMVEDQNDILRILTWEAFFHPEVIKSFEKKHDIKIELISYFTRSMRDYIIKETSLRKFDIVITEQLGVIDYYNLNFLRPLEVDKLPNYKYIDSSLVTNDVAKNYGVNISYGSMGIIYRNDKDFTPPKSWKEFINPDPRVYGKVELIHDADDSLDVFLIGLGFGLSNYSLEELFKAAGKLNNNVNEVFRFGYNVTKEEDDLMTGKTWLATMYGFEALQMVQENKNISFVYPEEGVKVWRDYISVLQGTNKNDLSWAFVNHVLEPKNAALNTEYNLYASTNKESKKYIKSAYLNNKFLYPPKGTKFISDEMLNEYIISKKHYLYQRIVSRDK